MVTWPAVAADRPVMRLLLSAAHPAAALDRADGERRKEQVCEGREELNCPTSEMDWRERTSRTNKEGKEKEKQVKILRVHGKELNTYKKGTGILSAFCLNYPPAALSGDVHVHHVPNVFFCIDFLFILLQYLFHTRQ